jgi:DNA helicase HerA-like ATPase
MTTLQEDIKKTVAVDIFRDAKKEEQFIGRPFYIDYSRVHVLVADAWKNKVGGLPQGTFLLAFFENIQGVNEAILLRALGPTKLPTDNDVISSMIEYYKDDLKTAGKKDQLDQFTRYQFSFSGLECRVLGTFFKDHSGNIQFGADLENFFSAHNYSVYKAEGDVLEQIVNYKDIDELPGNINDVKIGHVRYSSSRRFQEDAKQVPVYITSKDFLGKRTALFGMTRTGKSNTIKKIVQASFDLGEQGANLDEEIDPKDPEAFLPFSKNGIPKYKVGQISFDINGEYANANMQDEGTAIFEIYKKNTVRYSVLEKPEFEILKVNFYKEIEAGFNLISNHFKDLGETSDYVNNFLSVSFETPDDITEDVGVETRYNRKIAAYMCCLYRAGFTVPDDLIIKFKGSKEINEFVRSEHPIDPSKGISIQDACTWFDRVWEEYRDNPFFTNYKQTKGHEWADDELKALLGMLTRHKEPGSSTIVSGFIKLRPLKRLHTSLSEQSFETAIVERLREGKIVIIDLSQGDPEIQRLYSERICTKIFQDSMARFIENTPNNFIQFYFEEAHNLFPKKDDKDLSQIYNRIAKEGAKLNLGLIYATQEVSSISSNILKNTQNWFIAHLNNDDELKELQKYYDFGDFIAGLTRFSANIDKGFARMKTYSNPFVVPVQIDRFLADRKQPILYGVS